jgi:hypothetical protein
MPSPVEDAVDERSGGGIPAVAIVGAVAAAALLFGSAPRLAAAVAAVAAARALATASLCFRFSTTYHTYAAVAQRLWKHEAVTGSAW